MKVCVAAVFHRSFGIEHIADNGNRKESRKAPNHTDDDTQNYLRHVAVIATDFSKIYRDGNRLVLRSSKLKEALILQKLTDSDTGERFYSVVKMVPLFGDTVLRNFGEPVWSQGRSLFPNDRLLQSSASVQPIGQESQRPMVEWQRNQTSKSHCTASKEKNQAWGCNS